MWDWSPTLGASYLKSMAWLNDLRLFYKHNFILIQFLTIYFKYYYI